MNGPEDVARFHTAMAKLATATLHTMTDAELEVYLEDLEEFDIDRIEEVCKRERRTLVNGKVFFPKVAELREALIYDRRRQQSDHWMNRQLEERTERVSPAEIRRILYGASEGKRMPGSQGREAEDERKRGSS